LNLLYSLEGRPIDLSEWRHLKISAAALSAQVNRIEFKDGSEAEVVDDDGYDGKFDEEKEADGGVDQAGKESPAEDAV
jgi:hypothetical protein